MKRTASFILVTFLCIFVLIGCGSKGEPIDFEMDGQQMLYKGSKQGDLAHGHGSLYLGEITVQGHDVEVANKGQLLYPTGEVFYDGELNDGLPHGKGTYYDLEGNVLTE